MSCNGTEAQVLEKSSQNEREDVRMTLYVGVFFDDSFSEGKALKLSGSYRIGAQKECERSYAMSKTVANPDCIYMWKGDNLIVEDSGQEELFAESAEAVNLALSNILELVSGYSHCDDLKLYVDIYGIDKGMVAAYVLAHIIEPDKDGFDQAEKERIFRYISSVEVSCFQGLTIKKEVNHLQILNTTAALKAEKELTTPPEIGTRDKDTYLVNGYVQMSAKGRERSQLVEHGISKAEIERSLDNLQMSLDVAGVVDVYCVGMIADALNVIISLARGKWADAGLSLLAIVPGIGNYATAAKMAIHSKTASKIIKNADKAGDATKETSKLAKNDPDIFSKNKKRNNPGDEVNIQSEELDNVISMEEYKTAKEMSEKLAQSQTLKTGTDSTIYDCISGIGGGSDWNFGRGASGRGNRVDPVSKVGSIWKHNRVGTGDCGQEHAINIINMFKFKGGKG